MSDRIPGTSYDNPIRYRGYRVFLGDSGPWSTNWHFVHEDYDGPEDNRCGVCRTVIECRAEIDEQIADPEDADRAAVLAPFNAVAERFFGNPTPPLVKEPPNEQQ